LSHKKHTGRNTNQGPSVDMPKASTQAPIQAPVQDTKAEPEVARRHINPMQPHQTYPDAAPTANESNIDFPEDDPNYGKFQNPKQVNGRWVEEPPQADDEDDG
jgi:hypothetical protein